MPMKKLNRKALDSTTALPRSSKDTTKKRWIRMPFLGGLSMKLSKQLRQLGFHPAFYTIDSIISTLCNRKDRIDPQDRSGVYILPCDSCNAVYIGEPGRQFRVRLHEHLDQKPPSSAFSKHLTGERHAFRLGSEKLLHPEDSLRRRLALETLESVRHAHAGFNVPNYSPPTEAVIRHLFP